MKLAEADDHCWFDGRRVRVAQAALSIADPGVLNGVGSFETLFLIDGHVPDLDAHLDRLTDSCARLGLTNPAPALWRAWIAEAAGAGAPATGWIRLVVTGAGHAAVLRGAVDPSEIGRPVTAVILPWRRHSRDPLAKVKSLSYAGHARGLVWARERGCEEGLWRNERGHLTEACSANLFLLRSGALITARIVDGILPGTVRSRVIEAAAALGMRVHESKVRLPSLRRSREAFLSSSVRGLRPLIAVDGIPIGDGAPGPITRRISEEVRRRRGTKL